jgi:hypothetical protein
MKFITASFFAIFFFYLKGQAQTNSETTLIDTALAKRITVSGFCLCQTSLTDLKNIDSNLEQVQVEEMDSPKKCFGQDSRFENGKGYYSEKYKGIIFQKDQSTDFISKIRLTKDFKGNLPDGTAIDLHSLRLRDVFKIYPELKEKWGSRGCSDYWHFSNDTLLFYVRIDSTKKPQFPIDEAYYYDKPVEAIDLVISCYGIFERANNPFKKLFNDPVFFVDSINITRIELQEYQPNDIAVVTVYKDTNAIKLVGPQGKDGVVYVETKKFARSKYWNYFKTKSGEYLKAVPTSQPNTSVVYILNGKVLKQNFEGDLSAIEDKNFIDLKVIDQTQLIKDYSIRDKTYGVLIRTKTKTK